jgi:hypothetical protein
MTHHYHHLHCPYHFEPSHSSLNCVVMRCITLSRIFLGGGPEVLFLQLLCILDMQNPVLPSDSVSSFIHESTLDSLKVLLLGEFCFHVGPYLSIVI